MTEASGYRVGRFSHTIVLCLLTTLRARKHFSLHLPDEQTEAQRGKASGSKSLDSSRQWVRPAKLQVR